MTKEDINKFKEELNKNQLYKTSKALHKEYQFEQFTNSGQIMNGQQGRIEDIGGKHLPVIYNFDTNGLLHSEEHLPAIEYPNHWEYWEHGLIKKVVSESGDYEEYWEHGVPIRIEKNLIERRKNGEKI